jgi:CheY-like chemotaxis protein
MKAKTDNKRILWIDNDIPYIRPYTAALRSAGYKVVLAPTITEAKAALTTFEFDLVVIDMMIPTVSEEELAEYSDIETDFGHNTGLLFGRWIKTHYTDVPIVGCTVRLDSEIKNNFMRFGTAFSNKVRHSRNTCVHAVHQ